MNKISEFVLACDKCAEQCLTMIEHEKAKRQALLSGDEKKLEQALHTMQSDMMLLDQLEKKRLEKQGEAGFEGMTSTEIAARAGEKHPELPQAFERLRIAAGRLKDYNAKALEIAKGNLQIIEVLEKRKSPASSTYRPGQSGSEPGKGLSFTTKV